MIKSRSFLFSCNILTGVHTRGAIGQKSGHRRSSLSDRDRGLTNTVTRSRNWVLELLSLRLKITEQTRHVNTQCSANRRRCHLRYREDFRKRTPGSVVIHLQISKRLFSAATEVSKADPRRVRSQEEVNPHDESQKLERRPPT